MGGRRPNFHLFPHSLGPAANRVLPARTPAQPCPPTRAPSASPASSGISSFRSILRAPHRVPGTPHALLPMCFCSRMPCLNLPASLPPSLPAPPPFQALPKPLLPAAFPDWSPFRGDEHREGRTACREKGTGCGLSVHTSVLFLPRCVALPDLSSQARN